MTRSDEGSRRRHPSGRGQGAHLVTPLAMLAQKMPGIDGPHRSVAIAAIAVRGDQGRSRARFAAAYGLDEDEVKAIESGWTELEQLAAPLVVLTPVNALAIAALDRRRSMTDHEPTPGSWPGTVGPVAATRSRACPSRSEPWSPRPRVNR